MTERYKRRQLARRTKPRTTCALASIGISALLVATVAFARTPSDARATSVCSQFYGDACSEAIGTWLPRIPHADFDAPATRTALHDDAWMESTVARTVPALSHGSVRGGTFFVYGDAGPPKGNLVFDPRRRLAFYDEGCCAWHHVVLSVASGQPPKHVASRSLARVRLASGIALGTNAATIESAYGAAPLRAVAGLPQRRTLAYRREFGPSFPTCEVRSTFLLERDRLIGIDIRTGC